jgi:hypothetical protein
MPMLPTVVLAAIMNGSEVVALRDPTCSDPTFTLV